MDHIWNAEPFCTVDGEGICAVGDQYGDFDADVPGPVRQIFKISPPPEARTATLVAMDRQAVSIGHFPDHKR